jgi:hypothetical protein
MPYPQRAHRRRRGEQRPRRRAAHPRVVVRADVEDLVADDRADVEAVVVDRQHDDGRLELAAADALGGDRRVAPDEADGHVRVPGEVAREIRLT